MPNKNQADTDGGSGQPDVKAHRLGGVQIAMVVNAWGKNTEHCSLAILARAIASGRWQAQVEGLRRIEDKESKAYKETKKLLPGAIFNAYMRQRGNDHVEYLTGLIGLDYDHVPPEKMEEARGKLEAHKRIVMVSTSCGGQGIKPLFYVSEPCGLQEGWTKEQLWALHLERFNTLSAEINALVGMEADLASKDVSRMCFVMYDPLCRLLNPDMEVIPAPAPPEGQVAKPAIPVVKRAGPWENSGTRAVVNWQASIIDTRLEVGRQQGLEFIGEHKSRPGGYLVKCPGINLHTNGDADTDCVWFIGEGVTSAPSLKCVHTSCHGVVEQWNQSLRSAVGKVEFAIEKARRDPPMTKRATGRPPKYRKDPSPAYAAPKVLQGGPQGEPVPPEEGPVPETPPEDAWAPADEFPEAVDVNYSPPDDMDFILQATAEYEAAHKREEEEMNTPQVKQPEPQEELGGNEEGRGGDDEADAKEVWMGPTIQQALFINATHNTSQSNEWAMPHWRDRSSDPRAPIPDRQPDYWRKVQVTDINRELLNLSIPALARHKVLADISKRPVSMAMEIAGYNKALNLYKL